MNDQTIPSSAQAFQRGFAGMSDANWESLCPPTEQDALLEAFDETRTPLGEVFEIKATRRELQRVIRKKPPMSSTAEAYKLTRATAAALAGESWTPKIDVSQAEFDQMKNPAADAHIRESTRVWQLAGEMAEMRLRHENHARVSQLEDPERNYEDAAYALEHALDELRSLDELRHRLTDVKGEPVSLAEAALLRSLHQFCGHARRKAGSWPHFTAQQLSSILGRSGRRVRELICSLEKKGLLQVTREEVDVKGWPTRPPTPPIIYRLDPAAEPKETLSPLPIPDAASETDPPAPSLASMYRVGYSLRALAKLCGQSHEHVRGVLRASGVELRKRGGRR